VKSELLRAKDRAWEYFSKYIRARDPYCATCGGQTTQAGHFWHGVLDFDEMNINGQCTRCNLYLSGNLGEYAIYLIEKYGMKEFKKLQKRKYEAMKGEKRSAEEYRKLSTLYKKKWESILEVQI
jgi:hypothetical protein